METHGVALQVLGGEGAGTFGTNVDAALKVLGVLGGGCLKAGAGFMAGLSVFGVGTPVKDG